MRCMVAGIVAAAVGAAVLLAADTAHATETVTVPSSGSLGVTGHGYGHGHGLSQYGAKGGALRGASAAQILSFYYPATTAATLPNSNVRVQLTANAGLPVVVTSHSALQVRDAVTGGLTALTTAYPMWRISYSTTYGYLLQYLSGSAWHTLWTSPHAQGFVGGYSNRLFPAPAATVSFTSVPSRAYRGELRAVWTGASFITINYVLMDLYLRSVVPRESPASWPAAALQAQAVAARSYSGYKRTTGTARAYDVYDTTADQVYGGYVSYANWSATGVIQEDSRTDAAVAATANQFRTYGGTPIFAQFNSSNGGFSSAGSVPYLRAAADPWEQYSANPYATWTISVAVGSLRAVAGLATLTQLVLQREATAGGHVTTVSFTGTDSAGRAVTVTRTGEALRSYFGWRSTYFGFDTGSSDGGPTGPWPLTGDQIFAYSGGPRVINGSDAQATYRPYIAAIQREAGVPETSRYDTATVNGVSRWQGLVGLPETGIVDANTWQVMTVR
ncbi:MAG: SpoIID/LytB domain-containing protein [Pseudonocardiales bacterium]